ncbi:LIM domain-containing protein [Escovopsis weberi]|uniref:LIM domain-containing protein n=1 Tax=Escovopsis weberi TaxID=150374 RepID=A0A0M9VVE7_ESCWE|nr:LIM domain-containing protein [Escovopsis weberi]
MTNGQVASYLDSLRSNKVTRPGGARAQPPSSRPLTDRSSGSHRSVDLTSPPSRDAGSPPKQHQRASSQSPSVGVPSIAASRYSGRSSRSHDYYPPQPTKPPIGPSEVVPTSTYIERGQRWMEKKEAHSLRDAMEEMHVRDSKSESPKAEQPDEETRIFNAALDEAAELVWQHQNGVTPRRPDGPYRYRPHLRKDSYAHARAASVTRGDGTRSGRASATGYHSPTGNSSDDDEEAAAAAAAAAAATPPRWSRGSSETNGNEQGAGKSKADSVAASPPAGRLFSRLRRDGTVGESRRPFSQGQAQEGHGATPSKGSAKQAVADRPQSASYGIKPSSSFVANRIRSIHNQEEQHQKDQTKRLERVEIHRNPPTRSRNAQYTVNAPLASHPLPQGSHKNGVEIRSDDIRQATSMLMKDRSPNLPEPTAVSDSPGRPIGRGLPRPPRGHWSPAPDAFPRSATVCHECGLPIEGKFVALAGAPQRFHPNCFRCHRCDVSLEAMEITPEPTDARNERLERIRRRAAGEVLEETPGMTMAEDGDERLRFFCHLDWHELFAPRCKHCGTPILEEHIVALGAHWHFGHFFCAECGDPFEHGMTHIEKDGYAWCINCQTKRTERRAPKCRMCKQAVIGQYIRALGGEWHEHCFRCFECKGSFDDGQIFPKEVEGGSIVLCTRCRARELKY